MDEFPDLEDEFEALYADEMEVMRELEGDHDNQIPSSNRLIEKNPEINVTSPTIPRKLPLPAQTVQPTSIEKESDPVSYEDLFGGSTSDIEEDGLIIDEPLEQAIHTSTVNKENVPGSVTDLIRGAKRKLIESAASDEKSDTPNEQLFSNALRNTYKRKPLLPMVDHLSEESNIRADPDIALIDHINALRKRIKLDQSSGLFNKDKLRGGRRRDFRASIHTHLPQGEFQAFTTIEGRRFYLDEICDNDFATIVKSSNTGGGKTSSLLSKPFQDLKSEAQEEYAIMLSKISAERLQGADGAPGDASRNEASPATFDSELWVEKYRPKSYFDLLSDEATNRTVLRWIMLWDKVVFGRERNKRKRGEKKKSSQTGFKPKFFNKFFPEVLEEFDEIGRPKQKVVLLHGPPGLGKTTLAHIIAEHAGYNIVEMNASDDRSVEVFRRNLENAMSMKAVFGDERRPNCLIIDEIDGAPAPSINHLVTILSGKKVKQDTAKKKKKDVLILKRPVICICNDLYTPALRNLRQMSLVIQFPPTQATRLAQRLFAISDYQKLKADLSVLLALCEKTQNDIRSCLSVLQFVRSNSDQLKFGDLSGVTVGQKDYQKSMFAVWREVFTIPRPRKQYRSNPHEQKASRDGISLDPTASKTDNVITLADRLHNVVKLAQSCGEYDRLIMGWFENYPAAKIKHTFFEPVISCLEWASFSDTLQKEMYHSQNWILMGYVPHAFAAFHAGFASHQSPKITFPNKHNEANTSHTRVEAMLTSLTSEMDPHTLLFSTKKNLIFDILPFLGYILQPSFRSLNIHLLSKSEKKDLAHLVDTMIAYNLTYVQERTAEGQYTFNLEPNIDEASSYPDVTKGRALSYSSKQLLAREVELEKVRRSESYFERQRAAGEASKKVAAQGQAGKSSKKQNTKGSDQKVVPNHLQKLEQKMVDTNSIKKAAPMDFFGREIVLTSSQQDRRLVKRMIKFKFNEGYTNAVRRPAKVKQFTK